MLVTAMVNINRAITSTITSGRRSRIHLVSSYCPHGPPVNYDLALAVLNAYLVHGYCAPVILVTGDFLLSAFRAAKGKQIFDQALANAQAARTSYIRTMILFASAIPAYCVILGCAVVHGWKK